MRRDLDGVSPSRPVALELGCGSSKRNPAAIAIDVSPTSAADVVGDAVDVLARLPTASVASIDSEHFLEHVERLDELLAQATRVLVDGGRFRATVPHFSNPYFYSDPTHRRWFGLYTFCYFAQSDQFRRKVPRYGGGLELVLERVTLGFRASTPFFLRHMIRRAFGIVVNSSRALQEFYEDVLSSVVSCYEITYELRRLDRPAM